MTNEYDVIISVTRAMADMAEVTQEKQNEIMFWKHKHDDLESENERLDNLSNQLQEQNNLLTQDIETKDKEHEKLAGYFANNQSRIQELESLLSSANAELALRGKKK